MLKKVFDGIKDHFIKKCKNKIIESRLKTLYGSMETEMFLSDPRGYEVALCEAKENILAEK